MLLVRRHRYTGTLSYYRCWTPGPGPLSKLIAIASAGRRIEEDHQLAKRTAGLAADGPAVLVAVAIEVTVPEDTLVT